MGQIISGQVFYSRKTKPGDYEHEQADVRLDFNLEDGEAADPFVAHVGVIAKIRAHAILNGSTSVSTAALPAQLAGASGKDKLVADAAALAGAPKTGTAEATPAAVKPPKPPKPSKPAPEPKVEPAATEDDDMAALLGAAPVEITDADLVAKVTSTNARIKNPTAIKALTGKYVAFPKGVKDIPPSLRPSYIAELEALQPAA